MWRFVALVVLLSSPWVASQNRALDCTCTDVDPRFGQDKHLKFVRARCWEHLKEGECDNGFMFNTVQELGEGFCQITCGRCDCCRTLRNVADDEGLTDWIWAMETAGLTELDEPGWEVAVLAARDGGVDSLLSQLGGWSRGEVQRDAEKQETLREALLYNMISPLPDHWAVYTSPFFTEGLELSTELKGARLTVRDWGDGNIGFQGPGNSATVQSGDFDKDSCKGFLHITDQYVLPSGGGGGGGAVSTPARATSDRASDGCQVEDATQYGGELIETVKADHAEDCCAQCSSQSGCTVWTFCPREAGCHEEGDGTAVWWGDCQLMSHEGGEPTVIANGGDVPYQSGLTERAPPQAAG